MTPERTTLVAALLAGLLTAGGLSLLQHRRAQESTRLRYENNRMRFEAGMRRHAAATSVGPTAPGARPAAPPPQDAEARQTPNDDYRDAGQATPQATLQTFAWACAHGDTARVEQLLWFEAGAREKARAFMATLPEAAHATWATPEAMAAALFVADAGEHPFPAATILAKTTPAALAADRMLLVLPGAGPLREHTEYVKHGDSWSYVITAAMVDEYIARTSRERPK